MFKALIFFLYLSVIVSVSTVAQKIDATYIRSLYRNYPTQKSDFCPGCKLWVNPYFKSIADTISHRPLLTFYIYTKAHRMEQETSKLPRKGIYAGWHSVIGQPDETALYRHANKEAIDRIAKGHCQAWILLAWCADAAILSNTYTFNAAMEYQEQNIGTELATEELCRKLTGFRHEAVTDSVKIWCGTFGSKNSFSLANLTATLPAYFYKVLQYTDYLGQKTVLCYWMPNEPGEKRALLPQKVVSYQELVLRLGFEPMKIFNAN